MYPRRSGVKMKRKVNNLRGVTRKAAIALLAAVVGFGVMLPAAANASAVSTWKSTTVASKKYQYRSSINNAAGRPSVGGYAEMKSLSGNVPSGYMGGNGRVYSSGGSLLASSGWAYNSSSASSLSRGVNYSASHGAFYSQSRVQAWNGSSYLTYTANRTVNQNW